MRMDTICPSELEQRAGIPKSPVGEITVTVDLRGAMRSFATGVCVLTTYLDEATGRRHDGLLVDSLTSVSLDPRLVRTRLPVGDRTVAIEEPPATGTQRHAQPARHRRGAAPGRLNRRGTSTSNGRSVTTGQPSLISNRCYEEYL